MGCKTCKQKKQKQKKEKGDYKINLLPKNVQESGLENGSFIFKLIAFLAVAMVLPLILVVLVGQIFMSFFTPKFLPKITNRFKNFFIGLMDRYSKFKYNREVKKREMQFSTNRGYEEGSELVEVSDVEVHDNNNE